MVSSQKRLAFSIINKIKVNKLTVKLNLERIKTIQTTMEAIERHDRLIDHYSENKPGPAYLIAKVNNSSNHSEIQFDRDVMLTALKEQRQRYVDSIEQRFGIKYDASAGWSGDN